MAATRFRYFEEFGNFHHGHLPFGTTQALDRFFESWRHVANVRGNSGKGTEVRLNNKFAIE